MLSYLEKHLINPFCGPDWRWCEAQELLRSGKFPSRNCDLLGWSLWRFLRRRDKPSPGTQTPDIAAAVQLHETVPQRDEVQAWLLTGMEFPQVAEKTGLNAALIELYHDIFFSVRDRIQASDWIHDHVFFRSGELDEAWIWRKIAYHCPVFLEEIIEDSRGRLFGPRHDLAERIRLYLRSDNTPLDHPEYATRMRLCLADIQKRKAEFSKKDYGDVRHCIRYLIDVSKRIQGGGGPRTRSRRKQTNCRSTHRQNGLENENPSASSMPVILSRASDTRMRASENDATSGYHESYVSFFSSQLSHVHGGTP